MCPTTYICENSLASLARFNNCCPDSLNLHFMWFLQMPSVGLESRDDFLRSFMASKWARTPGTASAGAWSPGGRRNSRPWVLPGFSTAEGGGTQKILWAFPPQIFITPHPGSPVKFSRSEIFLAIFRPTCSALSKRIVEENGATFLKQIKDKNWN